MNEIESFKKALKELINVIDSDIINIRIDCRKTSKNINIIVNKEEKFNINL